MELETVASCPPQTNAAAPLALVEGEPLRIDPAAPLTLAAGLRSTAANFPERGIRIISDGARTTLLTYPELLRRAERVLAGLRQAGLAPGTKALLQVDSLENYFPAFWGCLLGGIIPTTVAIAPTYTERNGVVDKLANAWRLLDKPAVITTERLRDAIQGLQSVAGMESLRTLTIEDLLSASPEPDPHEPKPEDIAFIQLSSGSTGIPKCIQQSHGNIIAHIHSSAQFNAYSPDDITFNWLPMDHVVPILTFHLKDTYLGCQQMHSPTQLVLANPLLWLDLMEQFHVTHTWAPNFGFKLVSERLSRSPERNWDLSAVRFFMNAGEQVTMPVVRDFLRGLSRFGLREDAMQPAFGMAEVCTCMTYANGFELNSGARRVAKSSLNGDLEPANGPDSETVEFVSLGTVTPGISIRIADSENRVLPELRIGRLQIKGPVVTPGYFRNDEANADAFVGEGWFNTGDLGFIAGRELYLTGREKEMIIIRGAKYYCYEVEDVVNSIAGVEPTFVATCGTSDPRTGTEILAVFFVPADNADAFGVAQAIRKQVTASLGIAPGIVVPLPRAQFPKTTSGKIQRTQLRKLLEGGAFNSVLQGLERSANTASLTIASGGVTDAIAKIWEEVLERRAIPANAHIFELGGDSLKATQIASRIRERWQTDFPMHLLFGDAGTIAGMAQWIANRHETADVPPPIHTTPRSAVLPLSYSQLRLWLADQIDPGTSLYNIGRTFTIRGLPNFNALETALKRVVERHEILRTVYTFESMPAQSVLPAGEIPLPRHDLSHVAPAERERVVSNLVALEIARPFDLEGGPLLRAKLIRLAEDEHLLLIVFHQIVTDAWSLGLFAQELAKSYSGFASGITEAPTAALPVQYADYATWQQRWLADAALEKQLSFWRQQVNPPPAAIHLNSRSASAAENESSVREFVIQGAILQKLRTFNAEHNVTHYMTLLTVFKLLLARRTGLNEIAVGSPESGRRRVETESLLGCFVNMLMIRTQLRPGDTFRSLLARVRENTIAAFANADVPFEKVQALLATSGDRARLFNVWFGPIDTLQSFTMADTSVTPHPVFPPVAQFDLSCFLSENPDRLALFFEYKHSVLTDGAITQFVTEYESLLNQLLATPDARLDSVPRFADQTEPGRPQQQLLDV